MADMYYDGQRLIWKPKGESATHSFRATSGLVDSNGDGRQAKLQCASDRGPLPEGTYSLSLTIDAEPAADDGKGRCRLIPSSKIQSIRRGADAGRCERYWANWGWNRVRLEPFDRPTREACRSKRAGFYLHDSAKGYTHGCIEVERSFFTLLRKYASAAKERSLTLAIQYAYASTYGGTDK